jgi:hypothetical protein
MPPPRSGNQPQKPAGCSVIKFKRPPPADPAFISENLSDPPSRALQPSPWHGIRPADIYLYFDKVKYLKEALTSDDDLAMLRSNCKYLDMRYHGEWVRPKRGEPYQINIWPYRERIEVHVPQPAVLEYFGSRDDVKMTGADLASDLTFDDDNSKYRVLAIFEKHLVQPYQRKSRTNVHFGNGGISTGSKRKKGNHLTAYVSKPCRIDGIVDCWHCEDRRRGTTSLSRIGINNATDAINYPHRQYWQQFEDAGHLLDIDYARLGRHHANRHAKRKRRQSPSAPFHRRASEDHWLGKFIFRLYGTDEHDGHISVQTFLRNYGRGPYVIKLGYLSELEMAANIF